MMKQKSRFYFIIYSTNHLLGLYTISDFISQKRTYEHEGYTGNDCNVLHFN